jgi:hypothetical protein
MAGSPSSHFTVNVPAGADHRQDSRMKSLSAIAVSLAALAVVPTTAADTGAPPVEPQAPAVLPQADVAVASIEGAAQRMRQLLRRARARGSAAETACANEGLSRVDVALRNAREHARLAREAWAKGDARTSQRELYLVGVCREAARSAAGVADSCIGEAQKHDDTSVKVIVDSR